MADYNPNQFEPTTAELKAQARFPRNTYPDPIDELKKEVEELRAEVKKLKGTKTYTIECTQTVYYDIEAVDEEEARNWYNKVGRMTTPAHRGPVITNVKEKQ